MKRLWKIYVHKCKTTGKCYVGQTCQELETRWGNGKNYTKTNNLKFYNAIQKYGWQDFEHYIIATCDNLQDAYDLEQFYIDELDTFANGYNSTMGGVGSKGRKMTKETKEKIRLANKGKSSWVKYVPKEKTPMFGKHHTKETKRKIGNANRGRVISKEAREKMRLAKLGKKGAKRTAETKQKISDALKLNNYMRGKHTNNRDIGIPVIQYDVQGNIVGEYESIRCAERITGCKQINRAIKRNIKAGGYIWKKKKTSN